MTHILVINMSEPGNRSRLGEKRYRPVLTRGVVTLQATVDMAACGLTLAYPLT